MRVVAKQVVAELESRRATWQSWHVYAEAQRQVRGAGIAPEHIAEVVDFVVDAAGEAFINLTPEHDPIPDPAMLRRSDGTSVYRHTGADHFTTEAVLAAEQRVLNVATRKREVPVDPVDVELALLAIEADGVQLNNGQHDLVYAMATDPRQLALALAPAGSGKTTAMSALAQVWTDLGYDAVGLAPSAAAAGVLHEATGLPTETLAKLDQLAGNDRTQGLAASIGPRTLVVIDEAGLVDTLTLDRVVAFCAQRGATIRLVGDDQQLAAIGAGGVLRDIASTHGAQRLEELVRFTDTAEAAASLDLRAGDPAALGFYLDHDRVHVGDTDTCVQDVFDAWTRAQHDGRDCLMLAPTRDLVAQLNDRARRARLDGHMPDAEVALRDGNHAPAGDTVITRHNDRRPGAGGSDWVRNGDRWTVTAIHDDGSLGVRHARSHLSMVLPAAYVANNVDLGYASTVHTAQGLTADEAHGIVTGTESRQLVYTMLTRGRIENHVHLALDALPETADDPTPMLPGIMEQLTATEVLEDVLARDGAAVSATTQQSVAASPTVLLHQAAARYADAVARGTQQVLHGDAADALEGAGAGPLPWLPGVPDEVRTHPTWGRYLTARAERVAGLAEQVRADRELPQSLSRVGDLIAGKLLEDVVVWRAAQGVREDDRRILGPRVEDPAALAYGRHLQAAINQRYPGPVRAWAERIVAYVGHDDEHTLDLARTLDRLANERRDVKYLLARAAGGRPLPVEHATEALAYRSQRLVTRYQQTVDPHPRREPSRSTPELGL